MRKLIIHRKKQFVAAAMKVRICRNTELEGDIHLVDTNLEVLGVLKNGKTLEVDIPDDNVDLYVVFDKIFPQKFHSKWSLKAGESDEVLYTSARFNPFKGNPFTISQDKELTSDDKLRIRDEESSRKSSTKVNILYWGFVIAATIGGAILGFTLMS